MAMKRFQRIRNVIKRWWFELTALSGCRGVIPRCGSGGWIGRWTTVFCPWCSGRVGRKVESRCVCWSAPEHPKKHRKKHSNFSYSKLERVCQKHFKVAWYCEVLLWFVLGVSEEWVKVGWKGRERDDSVSLLTCRSTPIPSYFCALKKWPVFHLQCRASPLDLFASSQGPRTTCCAVKSIWHLDRESEVSE